MDRIDPLLFNTREPSQKESGFRGALSPQQHTCRRRDQGHRLGAVTRFDGLAHEAAPADGAVLISLPKVECKSGIGNEEIGASTVSLSRIDDTLSTWTPEQQSIVLTPFSKLLVDLRVHVGSHSVASESSVQTA